MKDIIVFFNTTDITYVTLNGVEIDTGIDHPGNVGYVLMELFDKLNYCNEKPLIVDLDDEECFSDDELELFYFRLNKTDPCEFFTEDELQILSNGGSVEEFVDKIRENLRKGDD